MGAYGLVPFRGGRPSLPHCQALTGILFVLKTGLPWEDLTAELNCGCGMSCWRWLRDWQADGTWEKVHAALHERLDGAGSWTGRRRSSTAPACGRFLGRRCRPEP